MLFNPRPGPWVLALPLWNMIFSYGFNRPLSYNLILEEVDRNAGAASSFPTFSCFMVGAFAMWLIALDWSDKIAAIGMLGAGSGGLMPELWLLLPRLAVPKR